MTDQLDRLLRIDDHSHLPGVPRGLAASWAFTPREWQDRGLQIARELAATGQPFTVAHIQERGMPAPTANHHWGGLMTAISLLRIAECIGWASHLDAHGRERPVRVWQRRQEGTP